MNCLLFRTPPYDKNKTIPQFNGLSDGSVSFFDNGYTNISINLDQKNNKIEASVEGKNIEEYNYIYFFGQGNSRNREVAVAIANILKFKKIKFIDKNVILPKGGGKLLQMTLCATNDLPIPHTIFYSRDVLKTKFKELQKELELPFILKTTNGSQGQEVFLIESENDFDSCCNKQFDPDVEFISQEFLPNHFDYRVLVLGGEMKCIETRTRQSSEKFRNNLAVGGIPEYIHDKSYPKELVTVSQNAAKLLERDVAGVDVIIDERNNKPYIIEINPAPGHKPGSENEKALFNYLFNNTKNA